MLRTIRNVHLRPRLLGYTVTTSGSAATIATALGKDDMASSTRNGVGKSTSVPLEPFRRAPIVVASAGSDLPATGPTVCHDTVATASSFVLECSDASAGAVGEGTAHALVLGWDSPVTDKTLAQDVKGIVTRARVEVFKVNGTTPAIEIGGKAGRLTENGTGDYTITFERGFGYAPVCVGTIVSGANSRTVQISSSTAKSVRVLTSSLGGSGEDNTFYLVCYGSDSKERVGRTYQPVTSSQRKPRIVAGRISSAAAVTIGTGDVTAATGATGVYTVTFAVPFKREPVVVATALTGRIRVSTAASTSAVTFTIRDQGDSTDLNDGFDFMAFGFDDVSQY